MSSTGNMHDADYAPLYSTRERLIILARNFAWAVPLFLLAKYVLLPWWTHYTANAQCYNYGSFTGIHVMFYSLFAGIPLLSAIVIGISLIPRAIKILKLGQDPLPGEKVLRKTRYRFGKKARMQAIILLLFPVCFLGIGAWGINAANHLVHSTAGKKLPACATTHSI